MYARRKRFAGKREIKTMKITILRSKFIEALKSVQNVVPGKGSLAVLQNALIECEGKQIRITATDLDISISTVCECDVVEEGKTTLPVKLLFNMVLRAPEGQVCVETDENDRATITAGSARFKLAGLSSSDFPELKEDGEAASYKLPQATLREMLRKTAYAASQDDTRRTLKGVLMSFNDGKLTMVATDGRRLALVENEMEFSKDAEKDIVLPAKAVQELQRSLQSDGDVEILVRQGQISFSTGHVKIYSKLMDDVYPNYRQVIPGECAQQIVIDRQQLLDALERASVMKMDEAHSTKLIFDENKLLVRSAASDLGEASDEVAIKYIGERIEIMFNPTYVMDPLKAIDDDEVTFHLNNGHSAAVIKCSIPFLYVLMPLRSN